VVRAARSTLRRPESLRLRQALVAAASSGLEAAASGLALWRDLSKAARVSRKGSPADASAGVGPRLQAKRACWARARVGEGKAVAARAGEDALEPAAATRASARRRPTTSCNGRGPRGIVLMSCKQRATIRDVRPRAPGPAG
jgi:hypothetical protein